jgi:hypothetical protein
VPGHGETPGHGATSFGAVIRRLVPLLTVGVLAACGSSSDDTGAATTEGSTVTDTEPAPSAPATTDTTTDAPSGSTDPDDAGGAAVAVPAALDFSAPLVGGGDIEVAALAGRPVLLWFWAPW